VAAAPAYGSVELCESDLSRVITISLMGTTQGGVEWIGHCSRHRPSRAAKRGRFAILPPNSSTVCDWHSVTCRGARGAVPLSLIPWQCAEQLARCVLKPAERDLYDGRCWS
jgi:hypothetical protein